MYGYWMNPIRYYDPTTKNGKVSRKFTFNENDDLQELEVVEIPGMRSEGEYETDSEPQTPDPEAPEREQRPPSPEKTISQPPNPPNEKSSDDEVEEELLDK
jgi:hypothetical protein